MLASYWKMLSMAALHPPGLGVSTTNKGPQVGQMRFSRSSDPGLVLDLEGTST